MPIVHIHFNNLKKNHPGVLSIDLTGNPDELQGPYRLLDTMLQHFQKDNGNIPGIKPANYHNLYTMYLSVFCNLPKDNKMGDNNFYVPEIDQNHTHWEMLSRVETLLHLDTNLSLGRISSVTQDLFQPLKKIVSNYSALSKHNLFSPHAENNQSMNIFCEEYETCAEDLLKKVYRTYSAAKNVKTVAAYNALLQIKKLADLNKEQTLSFNQLTIKMTAHNELKKIKKYQAIEDQQKIKFNRVVKKIKEEIKRLKEGSFFLTIGKIKKSEEIRRALERAIEHQYNNFDLEYLLNFKFGNLPSVKETLQIERHWPDAIKFFSPGTTAWSKVELELNRINDYNSLGQRSEMNLDNKSEITNGMIARIRPPGSYMRIGKTS